MFKNKLSPKLVDVTTIERAMNSLEQEAYKKNII